MNVDSIAIFMDAVIVGTMFLVHSVSSTLPLYQNEEITSYEY